MTKEQFIEKAQSEIYNFTLKELYSKNGWFITNAYNSYRDEKDYIVFRRKYEFNTMLSIPFSLKNLKLTNAKRKRSWFDVDLDIFDINRNPKPNAIASWREIKPEYDKDYGVDINYIGPRNIFLEFKFKKRFKDV